MCERGTLSIVLKRHCRRRTLGFFTATHAQKKEALRLPFSAVRAGFEPAVRLPVRQFSKLVVSATHPSHQTCPFTNGIAKI